MPDIQADLENTQRAFLQMQVENAQLKLLILDLRNELRTRDEKISSLTSDNAADEARSTSKD